MGQSTPKNLFEVCGVFAAVWGDMILEMGVFGNWGEWNKPCDFVLDTKRASFDSVNSKKINVTVLLLTSENGSCWG